MKQELESVHLTKREKELAWLVLKRMTNKQIAIDLELSVCTVRTHVHNIYSKLGIHTRLQLVVWCIKNGLTV